MKRTKAERMAKNAKIVARRLRQLANAGSSVPYVHRLADRSPLGRCGHKRCICHYPQYFWKHPDHLKDAEVVDYDDRDVA